MIEYGKIIKEESHHQGRVKTSKTKYQIPELINDFPSLMTELMKGVDLIKTHKTRRLNFYIEADKHYQLRLVTKEYEVEE